MRVKNGRSSGAIRRSTRRADSSRSVPCARVIVKTVSCRSHCRGFRGVGSMAATAHPAENVSPAAEVAEASSRADSRGYLRSLDKGGPVAIFNLQVEYMTTPVLDLAFAALSDPTRREIVQRLAKGAARVTDLALPFDMSFNAVSKHVKVLERAGLVRRTRTGREHQIALDPEPIRRIAGWASRYERFWSDRLDKLEAFLKTNRKRDC